MPKFGPKPMPKPDKTPRPGREHQSGGGKK